MRHLALFALVLLVAPVSLAQDEAGPVAKLAIDVQPDLSEAMTLTFSGLKGFTRYDGICLPEGARETRVYDELGEIDYTAREDNGRRSISFAARGDTVSVDMTRGAPGDADHPLYAANVNFCVPSRSSVVIEVEVPEQHSLFFMSDGVASGRTATTRANGPTHVFYSYEAPVGDAAVSVFDVAPFRVFVSTAHAENAREVAEVAAAPFRAALDEAGLEMPFDAMRVVFVPETPFAWEAGHYNGHGFVQVKDDTLAGDKTQGYPLSAARVLVHEAFHGASFAYGKGPVEDDVAWWLEGSAKRSERHVDAALPNATHHCEKSATEVRCWDFDDRITRAQLETGYGSEFRFDASWEPSRPQSDDTRHFYYSYSEYVVGAWIERHGEAEYQRVWDALLAAFGSGEGCPCDEGWLEGLLDDPDLFRPWRDVKAESPDEFDALVKPFVKDEEALQRELARQANPFSALPSPAWLALAAIGIALLAARRR